MATHPEELYEFRQQPARDLAGLSILMDLIEHNERPGPLGRIFPYNVQEKVEVLDLTIRENSRTSKIFIFPEIVQDKDLLAPGRGLSYQLADERRFPPAELPRYQDPP